MFQLGFNILATLIFMYLAVIWVKSNGYNLLLKFIFTLLTVYGTLICLKDFGFIIKP